MMCKICSDTRRLEVDREIIQGGNIARIAKKFDLPYNSLYNHAQNHISRQLAQAWDKKQMEQDFDLLGRIDQIILRAENIFKRNYAKGHDATALKALDSQRNTIELLAKISYSLHQSKLAEIELMQMQSGESKQQQEQQFQESLKVLTMAELQMLQALQDKIINQTKKVIIPNNSPDYLKIKPEKKTTYINTIEDEIVPENGSNNDENTESDLETLSDDELNDGYPRVEPMQRNDRIPSTPWEENPLNPRYHYRQQMETQRDMDDPETLKQIKRLKYGV